MTFLSRHISALSFSSAAAVIIYGLGYMAGTQENSEQKETLNQKPSLSTAQEEKLVQKSMTEAVELSLSSPPKVVEPEFSRRNATSEAQINLISQKSREELIVPIPPRLDERPQARVTRRISIDNLSLDAAISDSIPILPELPSTQADSALIRQINSSQKQERALTKPSVHQELSELALESSESLRIGTSANIHNIDIKKQPSDSPSKILSNQGITSQTSRGSGVETINLLTNEVSKLTDVSDHQAELEILALANAGVINNSTNRTFRPNIAITQLEYEKLILEAQKRHLIDSSFYLQKPDSIVSRADAAVYIYQEIIGAQHDGLKPEDWSEPLLQREEEASIQNREILQVESPVP